MILFTSGTTSRPKGVVSTHFNFISLSMMNNTASPKRADAGMSGVICAPLFHIGGLLDLLEELDIDEQTIKTNILLFINCKIQ